MKCDKIIIYLSLAVLISGVLTACKKKYPGDSYDFSDTAKKYIQLAPNRVVINAATADTTIIDGTDTIDGYYYLPEAGQLTVVTREGIPADVNIVIEYASPNATRTLNEVYPKFSQSLVLEVNTEDTDFGTADEIEGTFTLKSASGADLRLGYPKEGNNTIVPFTAYKPYVFHPYEE